MFKNILVKFPWIVPMVVSAVLLTMGALAHPLWGDEAETALFGRNIVKFGTPKGWDGENLFSLRRFDVLDKNLLSINPWPQFYLAALSFKALGESSFAARLPFVLISIANVPLLYYFCLKLTNSKRIAFLATLIASFCVQYILFAFQARYYALTIFSGLLFIIGALGLRDKALWPKILFVTGGALSLYSNYVSLPPLFVGIFFGMLLRNLIQKGSLDQTKRFVFYYLTLGSVSILLFLPWFLSFKPPGDRLVIEPLISINPLDYMKLYYEVIVDFLTSNVFPIAFVLLIAPLIYVKAKARKDVSSIALILTTLGVYTLFVTVFTVLVDLMPHILDIRYHGFLFILFIALSAIVLDEVWDRNRVLFGIVLVLYLLTNVLTLPRNPRSALVDYIREVTSPYVVANEMVVDYLNKHSKDGDTVFVNIDREYEPLLFLLKKRVRFINRLPLNSQTFISNRGTLPLYVYNFLGDPDWIILYSKREVNEEAYNAYETLDIYDYRAISGFSSLKNYEEITLPVYFSDTTRPEMHIRSFKKIHPVYTDQVFIYRKKGSQK